MDFVAPPPDSDVLLLKAGMNVSFGVDIAIPMGCCCCNSLASTGRELMLTSLILPQRWLVFPFCSCLVGWLWLPLSPPRFESVLMIFYATIQGRTPVCFGLSWCAIAMKPPLSYGHRQEEAKVVAARLHADFKSFEISIFPQKFLIGLLGLSSVLHAQSKIDANTHSFPRPEGI